MDDRMELFVETLGAIARAQIRAAGMQALNQQRFQNGDALAYDAVAFDQLIDEEGIGPEAIEERLRG